MTAHRTAVALVAKSPEPGKVKTRFCPPCTPQEAAAFARAFLEDTAAMVTSEALADSDTDVEVDVWCSHAGDAALLRSLLPGRIALLPQRGSDFAQRLSNAADDLFARGYASVVLLGADCPTVNVAYLRAGLAALRDRDVVLGPAADGGYVLIGLRRPDPNLFLGIEMGTDRVLASTLQRARGAGYSVTVLEVLHDLDTIEELLAAEQEGQLSGARQTTALLATSSWAASRSPTGERSQATS